MGYFNWMSRQGEMKMFQSVRLERIQIEKLFDKYTYDIDVKNDYDVSILIGPNGIGKTTIFKLIDAILSPTAEKIIKILEIPFDNCLCTMSNGVTVGFEYRGGRKRNINQIYPGDHLKDYDDYLLSRSERIELEEIERRKKTHTNLFYVARQGDEHEYLEILLNAKIKYREYIKSVLEGAGKDDIFDSRELKLLYNYAKVADNNDNLEGTISGNLIDKIKKMLLRYCGDINVSMILADRLHQTSNAIDRRFLMNSRDSLNKYDSNGEIMLDVIQKKAKHLYQQMDNDYGKLVSEARDSLPQCFLNRHNKIDVTFEEFEKSWNKYVGDMEKYCDIGLIESNKTIIKQKELEKAFNDNGAFLVVYLEVFGPTLKPFDTEYQRLKLLVDIFNSRNKVTNKKLKYGQDGLTVLVDGKPLDIHLLSSGEKNDLIMFYNLIFYSKQGGLVLIDEPEISWHISWQEEYIDWLLKICEMNKLQAIVATHSPNIVNGHFELYAERDFTNESCRY